MPTLNYNNNVQDLSNMDEAIETCIKYSNDNIPIIIKSIILPFTIRKYSEKYFNREFIFSPEFLTERNAYNDALKQDRLVIGIKDENLHSDIIDQFCFHFGKLYDKIIITN